MSTNEEEQQDNNVTENDNCVAPNTQLFLTTKPSSSNLQTFKQLPTISNNNKLNNTHGTNLLKLDSENLTHDLLLLDSTSFNNSQVYIFFLFYLIKYLNYLQ